MYILFMILISKVIKGKYVGHILNIRLINNQRQFHCYSRTSTEGLQICHKIDNRKVFILVIVFLII